MRPLILLPLLGACAWTPVVHQYPSGLRVVRGDKNLLAQSCGTDGVWDDGTPRNGNTPTGCYDADSDTIYLRNTNDGAKALLHELAHREGIDDPAGAGFDW